MKLIKDIIQGAGYLEGFGEHPGTLFFWVFVLMCGLAGAGKGGFTGFLAGSLVAIIFFGPMYIIGCVGRARDYQERQKRLDGVKK